jgi:DNA-directed RNA polymerase omega subunit
MPLDNISELKRRVPGGKYALTRAVAERARQLQSGETPLVEVRTPNPLSVAIDEICNGKVSFIMHPEEAKGESAATSTDAEETTTPDADILPVQDEATADSSTDATSADAAVAADASNDGLL